MPSSSLHARLPNSYPIYSFANAVIKIIKVGISNVDIKVDIDVPYKLVRIKVAHLLFVVLNLFLLIFINTNVLWLHATGMSLSNWNFIS